MYAIRSYYELVTSSPLERRTLAIFLSAELGFFGVAVLTAVHTPLFCGEEASTDFLFKELNDFCNAGAVDFFSTRNNFV